MSKKEIELLRSLQVPDDEEDKDEDAPEISDEYAEYFKDDDEEEGTVVTQGGFEEALMNDADDLKY